MILGVDHLARSVEETDSARDQMLELGYRLVFEQRGLPNARAKAPFLAHWTQTHDLVLLQPPNGGVCLELVNHGSIHSSTGPFHHTREEVHLCTPSPDQELEFLTSVLGFRKVAENVVALQSVVPAWSCQLRLEQSTEREPCWLDSAGFSCLALLTNRLEGQLLRQCRAKGCQVSEVFSFAVNHRRAKVAFVRSRSGTLYELLEYERETS